MTEEKPSPAKEKIASFYKELATASTDLNSAADELTKTVSTVEEALRRLNLGVSAWHTVAGGHPDDEGYYWARQIGYSEVGDDWCIALRKTWGNYNFDDFNEETWAFAKAPKWMRIESVGRLPDLIEDLLKRTVETTGKLKTKTEEAKELAAAINAVAEEVRPKTSKPGRGK
jgi:prefoldin subunit 5